MYKNIDFLHPWVICGTQPSINLQLASIFLMWTDHDLGWLLNTCNDWSGYHFHYLVYNFPTKPVFPRCKKDNVYRIFSVLKYFIKLVKLPFSFSVHLLWDLGSARFHKSRIAWQQLFWLFQKSRLCFQWRAVLHSIKTPHPVIRVK